MIPSVAEIAALEDPYELLDTAVKAIDDHKVAISELGDLRARTVRALLDGGTPRKEIAERLGVHPQYVYQLAAKKS